MLQPAPDFSFLHSASFQRGPWNAATMGVTEAPLPIAVRQAILAQMNRYAVARAAPSYDYSLPWAQQDPRIRRATRANLMAHVLRSQL